MQKIFIGNVTRKVIALFCVSLIIIVSLIFFSRAGNSIQPSIILVTIDALRPDHLSCYGYKRNTSPNIDKLAEDGVLFSQVISQGSWTPPSIFSMFTSEYPNIHRVYNFGVPMNPNIPTLFGILKSKGYYLGLISGRGKLAEFRFPELAKEFDTFYPADSSYILADQVSQNAVKWLRLNKSKKFFLWLFYLDPHTPYMPPSPYDKLYVNDEFIKENNKYIPIADESRELFDGYGIIPRITSVKDITDINYYISQYDAEIRFVDEQIGMLLTELKKLNLYDNTLIIITSDHGEAMGEHNYYFVHGDTLYDELLKVPLIIHQKRLPKNIIIDRQVQSIDIMPTILDIARIKIQKRLTGVNLLSLIQKEEYYVKYAFSEIKEKKSIRTQNWKLIYDLSTNEYKLYNLKDDPEEIINLVNERKTIFHSLKNELHNFLNKAQSKGEEQKQLLDEETKRKLRGLGYLQ